MKLTFSIDSSQIDHHGEVELADELIKNASSEALINEVVSRDLGEDVLWRISKARRKELFNRFKGD